MAILFVVIDNKFASTRSISVGEFFCQISTLKVPRFQRNYSWDQEKAEALWNDLYENFILVKNKSHPVPEAQYLLGPVVLVSNEAKNGFFVIDGQQRLSTLTIMFCVVRDIMHQYNTNDGINKITDLLSNEFMGKRTEWKLELNDTDKKLFREIQEYESNNESQIDRFNDKKYKIKSNKFLSDNYKFLHDMMIKSLKNDFGNVSDDNKTEMSKDVDIKKNIPRMLQFINFVCSYNYVIMVVVDDDNTAFQIFETLNERGQTLSKSNLIKNHILNQIKNNEILQKEQSDRWNRIFDLIVSTGQRDDDFVMESYDSRSEDKNSLRSENEDKLEMSKNNLYKIIKKIVKDEVSCEKFVSELEDDSVFLSSLNTPKDYGDEDDRDDRLVLKTLKAKFIRVSLLAAYRKWYVTKSKDYQKFIKFMIKFFFKTRVVRQMHPGKIRKISDEAVKMINQGKSCNDVITKLKEYDIHDDFLYNFKKKFMVQPPKDAAKYVLKEFTTCLGTPYDDVHPIDGLTLEHILPQKYAGKWNGKDFFDRYEDDDKKLDEFVVRLGNMSLLKKAVNTKLQNEPFEIKKNNYDKDGNQVGYLSSHLEINKKSVCNYKKWTANIILEREKNFADFADKIWNLSENTNIEGTCKYSSDIN